MDHYQAGCGSLHVKGRVALERAAQSRSIRIQPERLPIFRPKDDVGRRAGPGPHFVNGEPFIGVNGGLAAENQARRALIVGGGSGAPGIW